MLSAVITALLLLLMLGLVTSFVLGGLLAYRRHKKALLKQQAAAATHPLALLGQPASQDSFALPASWYTRRRTLVSLGFITMILLTLFIQDGLTEGGLRTLTKGIGFTLLGVSQASDVKMMSHSNTVAIIPLAASARIVRIDSAARGQYYTDYQYQVWSYSSCSGIAMATVMNAYGLHLIAADVLQVELNLGVYDVNLGLLREEGIALTAAHYGFDASLSHARTLQDIIALANSGKPVIVGVRDGFYYPGGHIFVVRGGDSRNVYIADSSRANFQQMSYGMFLGMWQGFSAVLTPRQ